MASTLVLAYSGCGTCRKALKWLDARGVTYSLRAIIDAPPTPDELAQWIPASGLPVRKWLNTSGQSYRTLGKAKVDAADEATLKRWLAADGKLVKRPVVVVGNAVLVGFNEAAFEAAFGR